MKSVRVVGTSDRGHVRPTRGAPAAVEVVRLAVVAVSGRPVFRPGGREAAGLRIEEPRLKRRAGFEPQILCTRRGNALMLLPLHAPDSAETTTRRHLAANVSATTDRTC